MYAFRPAPSASVLTPEDMISSAYEREPSFRDAVSASVLSGVMNSTGLGTTLSDIQTPGLAKTPIAGGRGGVMWRDLTPEEVKAKGDTLYSTEADYKASPYFRNAVPFEKGMTESRAKALAGQVDLRAVRAYWATKRPYTSFLGNLAGAAVDPLNYIPITGEVGAALGLGRVATRALTGALDAAGNVAVTSALMRSERQRLGFDESWSDIAGNIAFSALAGGVVGGVLGRFTPAHPAIREALPETITNRIKGSIVLNDALDGMLHDGNIHLGENSKQILEQAQVEARVPQPSPVEVTRRESSGMLWFEGPRDASGIPAGEVSTVEHANVVEITTSRVREEMRGQGLGKAIYREAVDYALERGKTVESAPSVSASAARVYEALKKEGYRVEKNPNVTTTKVAGQEHIVSENSKEPVFKVTGGPSEGRGDIFKTMRTEFQKKGAPPKTRTPLTLSQFLAGHGGLRENGDLRGMDAHKYFGYGGKLVTKNGMSLDKARQLAVEAGYLHDAGRLSGGESQSTINDLTQALSEDLGGNHVFSARDADLVAAQENLKSYEEAKSEIDAAIARVADAVEGDLPNAIKRRAVEIAAAENIDGVDAIERAIMEDYHANGDPEPIVHEDGSDYTLPDGGGSADERRSAQGASVQREGFNPFDPAPNRQEPRNFSSPPREPDVSPESKAAEKRVASVQSGDIVAAQVQAAKDIGVDVETGKHDLEDDIQQLRERGGILDKEDEESLKAADETYAAATAWGDALEAARKCVK